MGIAVSIGVYAEIDSRRNISNKNNQKTDKSCRQL